MTITNVIFYVMAIMPIAWLCWLALRRFVFGLNRLLFLIAGMSIYGFFMKALVVPLTGVHAAHVSARGELAETGVGSSLSDSLGMSIDLIFYLGVSFVLGALLMLWLQRALALSPKPEKIKR